MHLLYCIVANVLTTTLFLIENLHMRTLFFELSHATVVVVPISQTGEESLLLKTDTNIVSRRY